MIVVSLHASLLHCLMPRLLTRTICAKLLIGMYHFPDLFVQNICFHYLTCKCISYVLLKEIFHVTSHIFIHCELIYNCNKSSYWKRRLTLISRLFYDFFSFVIISSTLHFVKLKITNIVSEGFTVCTKYDMAKKKGGGGIPSFKVCNI